MQPASVAFGPRSSESSSKEAAKELEPDIGSPHKSSAHTSGVSGGSGDGGDGGSCHSLSRRGSDVASGVSSKSRSAGVPSASPHATSVASKRPANGINSPKRVPVP